MLGVAVGLVLGLTGAGGSIFAVPLLMFGLDWSLRQAVPVSLLAVCGAALVGTIAAWNVSVVRYRAAMVMAGAGCCTAPLGIFLGEHLAQRALAQVFAAVLALVGVRMLIQARRNPAETRVVRASVAGEGQPASGPICRVHPQSGRLVWTRSCAVAIAAIGALTGFLSGLLGVGGGFVIVPLLRAATVLSMHSAVATSLMAIALTSGGTVIASVAMGRSLPWSLALPFALGTMGGMLIGRRVAPRLAGPQLQRGFACVMLLAAGLLTMRTVQA